MDNTNRDVIYDILDGIFADPQQSRIFDDMMLHSSKDNATVYLQAVVDCGKRFALYVDDLADLLDYIVNFGFNVFWTRYQQYQR